MPDNQQDVGVSGNGDANETARPDGLGLGERLRSARKARALSLERAAEALRLDEEIIIALEQERFEELGAPVFVRGHLKAYARLVGLPADTFVEAYHETDPTSVAIPFVQRSTDHSVTINPVMWGFCGLLILLGLILAIYIAQDDASVNLETTTAAPVATLPEPAKEVVPLPADTTEPARESLPGITPEPAVATDAPAIEPATRSEEPVITASEPVQVVVAPEPVVTPDPEPAPAVGLSSDLVRISLHFREDSWVEISDANRRLLFGLQAEGRRRELSGEPPFRLLLGNVNGVDLTVNDRPYAIPRADITGQVARFEITAAIAE